MKNAIFTHYFEEIFKVILLFALASSMAFSESLLAADMPCVKEICIGDGLDKLRGIKFQPVNPSRVERVSKRKQADRAEMYGGFQGTQPPAFLMLAEFDENSLDEIAKIKVACHPYNQLEGAYVSESGHKTNIQIALWPNKTGEMKWLVKGISRAYKGLESRGESDQLIQDLREKYAKWDMGKVGQPKSGSAGMLLVPLKEPILTLILAPTAEMIQADMYKKNPLCKPTKRTNLD